MKQQQKDASGEREQKQDNSIIQKYKHPYTQ